MADAAMQDAREGDMYALSPAQIGILSVNNLTYKLDADLSVCIARNVQSTFFQSQAYGPGANMVAVCNTGSSFVNLRQSYLVLEVKNNNSGGSASTAWFGANGGSAANFINRITIFAKNGLVLERIDNANQLAAVKVNYNYSDSWRQSVGSLMGMAESAAELGWAQGATQRFVIPLYVFSTLCDTMGSLCPSYLISGARFEIQLESAAGALMDSLAGGAKTLGYDVTACRLEFESYNLTDSVLKVMNGIAASKGLEVVCQTTQDTQAQRTTNAITMDVAKSCSRAMTMIYKERAPKGAASAANGYGTGSLFDPVASAAITSTAASGTAYSNMPTEWYVRAGQLYFPQTALRGGGSGLSQMENELFAQSLRAYGKLWPGQSQSCPTSLAQFRGSVASGAPSPGSRAAFALDLQRSATLTSGIPLSNSRQLSILFSNTSTFVASNSFNYLVDVYLTYQICIRSFITQCSLEV